MDSLTSHGYEYHTKDKNLPKWKCFIMRGMIEETDIENIKGALMQVGLPDDIEVTRFVTGHMRSNPNKATNILYKITMPANVDTKILKKVTGIAHSRVRFEPMQKSNVIQCKNCQRFSHVTRMCHYQYRCVKCNTQHDVGECPTNTNSNIPLACVNCGGNHSANNLKECQAAKKMMANRNSNINSNRNTTVNPKTSNNTPKNNMNSNHRQNPFINNNSFHSKNSNNSINSSGGVNRSWSSIVRGSANGEHGANLNMDLLRDMIQSIVTQCVSQVCSR